MKPSVSTLPPSPSSADQDLLALQKSLGLHRPHDQLGYTEKVFNPCQLGTSQVDCAAQHFVLIHFQLICSNAEGTTSVIQRAESLQPVSGQTVKWSLKNFAGQVQTDSRGYGQIRVIAPTPQAQHRLKLTVGNQFLYTRAHEITRIATPPVWCSQFSVSAH